MALSIIKYFNENSTSSHVSSSASCANTPATKASPAPVVSTVSTFKPVTLPVNFWKNT